MISSKSKTICHDFTEACQHKFGRSNGFIVCMRCGLVEKQIMTHQGRKTQYYEITPLLGSEIGNGPINYRVKRIHNWIKTDIARYRFKKYIIIQKFELNRNQKDAIIHMIHKHYTDMDNAVVFSAMALWVNGIHLEEIFEVFEKEGHNISQRRINLCALKYGYKPPILPIESYVAYYLKKLKDELFSENIINIIVNVGKLIWKIKKGSPKNSAIAGIYMVLRQKDKKWTQPYLSEHFQIKEQAIKDVMVLIYSQKKQIARGIKKNLEEVGEL